MSEPKRPIMDLSDPSKHSAGLQVRNGTVPDIAAFGDSGDLFSHSGWRDFFIRISGDPKVGKQIVGLCTQFMLRARTTKIENKGSAVGYNLDVSGVKKEIKDAYKIKGDMFTLTIVFANESTRVDAETLTPERFKCVVRPFIVPKMMEKERFPATSCAIGFDAMAKDMVLMGTVREGLKKMVASGGGLTEARKEIAKKDLMSKYPEFAMINEEIKNSWDALFMEAEKSGILSWLTYSSAISGAITQKEIYAECEETMPGTTFWAGIHCIMTDASNKRKASEVTADIRARYENSNFYADFKKKQNARDLPTTKTEAYMAMLSSSVRLMGHYIKAGTGMSQQEIGIIDKVIEMAKDKYMISGKGMAEGTKDGGVSNNDYESAEEGINMMRKRLLNKIGIKDETDEPSDGGNV